jgi:hypothetical protein
MEIFFIIVLVGIGVAIAATQSNKRKIAASWKEAASRLKIHHNAGDFFTKPELYGSVNGCRVKITIRTKNQGAGSNKLTRYEIDYPQALQFGLNLTEQSVLSGLKRFLGAQDIELGDPSFDDFVVVRSQDSVRAREFLNPARRLYVRRMLSLYPGAEITDSSFRWERKGVDDEPSSLVSNVKRMVDFAVNMTDEIDDSHERALDRKSVYESPKRLGDDLEAVFTVGDRSEPASHLVNAIPSGLEPPTAIAGAAGELASDTAPDKMHQGIDEPMKTAARTSDEVQQQEHTGYSPSSVLDVQDVCKNLFGPGKISFQTNEAFKRNYEGLKVSWSGKLLRIDSYPFDLVFGNHPGTRAEIEIAEICDDTFRSHTVKAVVQLPAEAYDALSRRTGETIAFTGTLVRYDSFMGLLFVARGEIAGS